MSDNGEVIYEPVVNSAVVGVLYDVVVGTGTGDVTAVGLDATASVTGANPDEHRRLSWGDGTADVELVLDAAGAATATHTYGAAGLYTVTGRDSAGNVLSTDTVAVTAPVVPEESPDEPEPDPEPEAAPELEEVPEDEPYDPGAYTVAEVEEYVTAHPEEAATVHAAEEAGKARSTLLDWLESAGP